MYKSFDIPDVLHSGKHESDSSIGTIFRYLGVSGNIIERLNA